MGNFLIQTFKLIEILMDLQAKKLEEPTTNYVDYCVAPSPSPSTEYVGLGVRYHTGFTLNYDVNNYDVQISNSDPEVATVFKNFMDSSPYRSVWIDSNCDGTKDEVGVGMEVTIGKTITVNSSKTVYVGLMGDNKFILNHNGDDIVRVENIDTDNFKFLNIFPLTLNSGENNLTFTGIGDGTENDSLGVIVLDNPIDDIMGLTNGQPDANKDPIPKSQWNVLYSSEESLTETIDIVTCPDGYSYNSSSDKCERITDISEIVVNDYGLISPSNIEDKAIDNWSIDFGDGTSDSGVGDSPQTFQHQYTTTGTYLVKFKIKYSDGTFFQGRKEFSVST